MGIPKFVTKYLRLKTMLSSGQMRFITSVISQNVSTYQNYYYETNDTIIIQT